MKNLSRFINFPLINQLAFYSLLGSGAFIILLWSPHILGPKFDRWTKIIIYIFPWAMLWLAYSWQVVAAREHRGEIIAMVSIIILGIVNAGLSDAPAKSLDPMRTFLLTGIMALWAAMFLVNTGRRREVFDWFCAGALAIIVLVEMSVWFVQGAYGAKVFQIFTLHPIPLGTLIILLSSGPMRLISSKNLWMKLAGGLLVLLSGVLIYITHKRGTWIALAAMLTGGMIFLARRRKYLVLSMLLAIVLLLPLQAQRMFARLDPNISSHVSILHRLELYGFALHIWRSHPIMGIGLRSFTQEHYLSDYQAHSEKSPDFPYAVAKLQTLDNMALTALVELGTGITVVYLALIILILVRYGRRLRSRPESSSLEWYRVLVVLGFAIHSLSYDALMFPGVNWLFHVQLGIMAACSFPEPALS